MEEGNSGTIVVDAAIYLPIHQFFPTFELYFQHRQFLRETGYSPRHFLTILKDL